MAEFGQNLWAVWSRPEFVRGKVWKPQSLEVARFGV